MAFRLTKAEDARKSELEGELNKLFGEADDAKSDLNEKISELVAEFNEKYLGPLNEKIDEARGFVEDIKNERQEEFDDKSERWQDGERGEAAQEWLQAWENAEAELETVTDAEAPVMEIDLVDAETILCDLPFEASN